MFARTASRWARPGRLAPPGRRACLPSLPKPARRYSTSTASPSSQIPQSSASMLGTLTSEYDKIAPRFEIAPSQIQIIRTPTEFYETLKAKISSAKTRIYLSTLYVGEAEQELIATIRYALRANPDLRVSFLTDALRGTRQAPNPCCASLLASLIGEFGDRVEIRMFHTPNLTGLRKAIIPKRINEGWGLQHMKLYGVDDELIISGANLSNDYFTDRQDRYHVFSSGEVTDYFEKIHRAVCSISYSIQEDSDSQAGYKMEWPSTNPGPSPLENPKEFRTRAARILNPLIKPSAKPSLPPAANPSSTYLFPVFQLTPLLQPNDTSTELPAMHTTLSALSTPAFAGSRWTFTAGYFNMTPSIRDLLLASNPSHATVIAASPWANGFYGSRGVSGMLPAAYSLLGRRFYEAVAKKGLSDRVALKEWRRGTVNEPGGWTYHAKGLWVTLPGEEGPSIAVVGSSNYTKRSYSLDLEANVVVVTGDDGLKRRLREEEKWLQEYAKDVDGDEFIRTERRVGLHVRIAMAIVTLLGGAL